MEGSSSDAPPRLPWLIKGVLLLGSGLAVIALVLAISRWRFLAAAERATATVSAVAPETMRDVNGRALGPGYRLSVSFRDRDGNPLTVRSPVSSSATSYRVGDTVAVDYSPGQPYRAVIATFADRWLLPLIVGGIGAVALLIGGFAVWMSRQPGTRFSGDGRTSFGMTLGTIDSVPDSHDDDARERRETMRLRDNATLPWVLLGLVVAAGIGFFAARMMPGGRATEALANTTATADPITPARGGNLPSDLRVEAPPMTSPPLTPASTPAPPPAPSEGNGPALTQMARAFLAQPAQDRAMQAALREKAAKLPGLCPALSFTPTDTLVARTPPPMFDAAGTMRRGLIRQRFTGIGCPDASPRFNLWIFAADPDAPIKTVAGYMGATRADPALQRDATPIALGIAARLAPGCTALSVLDTRLPPGATQAVPGPWTEEWLVAGCGRYIQLAMHFVPEANGTTRIEVPSTEAKIIR